MRVFKKNNKWSAIPVTFHGKLERVVKLWGFKCLVYDEKKEVIILWKKPSVLKDLIRHNFNYTSQLATSNNVKIADMIDFNEDIFCHRTFSLSQRAECNFSHAVISLSRCCGFAFSYDVTICFIRNGCVLPKFHCSLNKQWRHCSH